MTEHILGGRDIYEWRQEAETQAHEVERLLAEQERLRAGLRRIAEGVRPAGGNPLTTIEGVWEGDVDHGLAEYAEMVLNGEEAS